MGINDLDSAAAVNVDTHETAAVFEENLLSLFVTLFLVLCWWKDVTKLKTLINIDLSKCGSQVVEFLDWRISELVPPL